uniref:Uncharacterized protein n=1 Tax=Glossina austeni TaxID=7395 RepID=A0A1A9VIB3_GLOAU
MCIVITLENGLNGTTTLFISTRSQKELAEPAPIPKPELAPVPVQVLLHLQSLEGLCVCLMLAAVTAAAAAAATAATAAAPPPTAEVIVMVVVVGVVVVSLMPWSTLACLCQTIWKLVRLAFSWLFDVSPLVSATITINCNRNRNRNGNSNNNNASNTSNSNGNSSQRNQLSQLSNDYT